MKQYTLDEKIKATNHACDVLQKAFGVKPSQDEIPESWRQAARDIFGTDLFG